MFKKALKSVSGVEDARKKKKIQGPRQFESEEKNLRPISIHIGVYEFYGDNSLWSKNTNC